MSKIKVDDDVVVIAGKDKGKTGKVLKIVKKKIGQKSADKVIVSSINLVKKSQKPNPNKGVSGGIIEKEAAIDRSNIAIRNVETNKADRVGFSFNEEGKKIRIYKSTRKEV